MAARTDPRIGSEFLGYGIEAVAGRGGMGVVYRAYDARLKRSVALKLVAPELSGDEHLRERFLAETELAASLEHPNVIPIHDAGEVDGQLYLAMRYVEGTDLKTLLAEQGPLEPARAVAICSQVAGALDQAHELGLVHRDVKPSNVLLDSREHVYLADFGLSRRLDEPGIPANPGLSLGTPAYASPEQITGGEVDGRADVYSLGSVLYECLTGEPPFERDSELAMLWAHLQEAPPKASEHNPALPEAIDAVVARALAKDPEERYPTCSELVGAARKALGLRDVVVVRDRRAFLLLALGAVVLVGALAAGLSLSLGGGRPATPSTKPTLTPSVDSLQRIDSKTGALDATIPVGHTLDTVATGAGRVWVGSVDDHAVLEIEPKTNELADRVLPTPGPDSIAVGFGAVYVANNDGTLVRLDLSTQAINYFSNLAHGSVTVGEGAIWAIGPRGLAHVNRENRVVTAISRIGSSAFAVATGRGAVWVLDWKLRSLWRVDPRTDRVVKRIRLGFDPGGLAFGLRRVWVTNYGGDAVAEIDPAVDRIVRSINVGDGPQGVAVGDGSVWTANYLAGTVSRIDPRTHKATEPIKVGRSPKSITVGERSVWVAVQAS